MRSFGLAGALALVCVTAACTGDAPTVVDIDVIGTDTAPFETGVRLSPAARLVRAATAEGLVALDEQGRAIPALADRWIVTDDGLSYIFRLREGNWPDGTALSGESVAVALRAALRSLAGTGLAVDLGSVVQVRAMAGRVVEIRLAHAVPDLLQILAQPELGLFHKGAGGGPMQLKRTGVEARLEPIDPERLGLPRDSAPLRSIRLHAVPVAVALKRFDDGTVDVVLGGTFENFPEAEQVVGLARRRLLRSDPVPGLFGLVLSAPGGPLADPALREGVAMAIDRSALQAALAPGAWVSTTRLVASGSTADLGTIGERWQDLSQEQRMREAAGRVSRWRSRHGAVPALRIALPQGAGADILFQRLAADLGAIGLPLRRVPAGSQADLEVIDRVARYDRPEWYLNQFACVIRPQACSSAADARQIEARAATDSRKRAALLAEAEAELTATNFYVPLGSPVRWSLARDGVSGFAVNPTGFHPLPPLARAAR